MYHIQERIKEVKNQPSNVTPPELQQHEMFAFTSGDDDDDDEDDDDDDQEEEEEEEGEQEDSTQRSKDATRNPVKSKDKDAARSVGSPPGLRRAGTGSSGGVESRFGSPGERGRTRAKRGGGGGGGEGVVFVRGERR